MIRTGNETDIRILYQLKIGAMWRYFRSESIAFWGVCAYLFLEYVRPQSIYPALDFLPWTQLAVLCALVGCAQDRTVKWVSSKINISLMLFFLLIIFSSLSAYWPSISVKYFENFYTWLIIYFLIINIVNSEKRIFIFLCIFLLASFKLSLSLSLTWAKRGFSFTDWGLSGPPGFFQNSGELSIQMLVYWPIALGFAVFLRSHVSTIKYYILLLMPITGIMVILGASSRGAQLALLVQILFINFRSIFKIKVIASSLIVLLTIWFMLPDEQKRRFEFSGDDRTSIQRILYWENGVDMLNNHPITGVGYFNFIPYYEKRYRSDMLYEYAELPHNIFVQVGADLGYPALFVYLFIILYTFFKSKKIVHIYRSVEYDGFLLPVFRYLNVSLVGFVMAGQFVSVVYYPFLWIHLAMFIIFSECLLKQGKKKTGKKNVEKKLSRLRFS